MTRIKIALGFLTLALVAAVLLAAGPAGYHPVPFPRSDAVTMPLKGHNGDGTGGFCVTILGREDLGIIDVTHFVLDPLVRHRINQRNARTVNWFPLSTDPGVIVQEYRASVQNAYQQLMLGSGDPKLVALADVTLDFPELGDIVLQLDAAKPKPPTTTCMKSSCYGQPPTCRVTGCSAGCADCVGIRVPAIE